MRSDCNIRKCRQSQSIRCSLHLSKGENLGIQLGEYPNSMLTHHANYVYIQVIYDRNTLLQVTYPPTIQKYPKKQGRETSTLISTKEQKACRYGKRNLVFFNNILATRIGRCLIVHPTDLVAANSSHLLLLHLDNGSIKTSFVFFVVFLSGGKSG